MNKYAKRLLLYWLIGIFILITLLLYAQKYYAQKNNPLIVYKLLEPLENVVAWQEKGYYSHQWLSDENIAYWKMLLSWLDSDNIVNVILDKFVNQSPSLASEPYIIKRVFSWGMVEEKRFYYWPRTRSYSFFDELRCFSCWCSCYQKMEWVYVQWYIYILIYETKPLLEEYQKWIFRLNTLVENPRREKIYTWNIDEFYVTSDWKVLGLQGKKRKLPE